jgi:hypothetical protein
MKNETTGISVSKPVSVIARESLKHLIPSSAELPPLGVPSLVAHIGNWREAANYVITGKSDSGARPLVLTLAERFADNGGHVIWIGTTEDMRRMCEQLMFKIAGLGIPTVGAEVQLDAVGLCKLAQAHEQIGEMWIDCGDIEVEQEFLASVSSFMSTLIVVDESIFEEVTPNPFEILVRQTHARRMVEELRGTNPMSSVLWHLPMPNDVAANTPAMRPSLDDLPDAASIIKPEVVLLTHRDGESDCTELIVAANAYGPTGKVPMILDAKRLTWREIDIAA